MANRRREMDFWIQAGDPRTTRHFDDEDTNLDEAVETIFPLRTESAFMVWRGVHIPLGYKYDLSVMLNDILDMLERLGAEASGRHTVSWPSNTFSVEWNMKWRGEVLEIDAEWHSLAGDTEKILKNRENIAVEKDSFIAEWKKPLENIVEALTSSGYDEERLPGMSRLAKQCKEIRRPGILYRE